MKKESDQLRLEEALKGNPRQAGLWCSLGEMRARSGRVGEARAAFENALRIDGGMSAARFGLAGILKASGSPGEAIREYRLGLEQTPRNAQALLDLGVLLAEQSQVDEAIACWQRLLGFQPDHAQAHHNLGVAMAQQDKPADAIRCLERALALRPDYAEAHFNLANVLCNQKTRDNDRRGEGVEHYLQGVRIRPTYIEAMFNLGTVLTELNRGQEAVIWLEQTVRLGENVNRESWIVDRENQEGVNRESGIGDRKDRGGSGRPHGLTASAYNQLGLALCMQGRYDEAQVAYKRALGLRPDLAEAHCNLGNLFQELGRLPEALTCYELAIMQENQPAVSKWNRSLSLLQAGNFEQGWKEYEWRWQRKQTPPRPFKEPRWDGSPLEGRTLLIHMEQGLGDMVQFIRFAAQAKQRGGRVVVECPGFLAPLLARCPGVDEIFPEGVLQPGREVVNAPRFDVQISVMSLPFALGTTLAGLPAEAPYLFVDAGLVERWRVVLAAAVGKARTPPAPPCQGGEEGEGGLRRMDAGSPVATAPTTPPAPPSKGLSIRHKCSTRGSAAALRSRTIDAASIRTWRTTTYSRHVRPDRGRFWKWE